jgi:hypothetical protein
MDEMAARAGLLERVVNGTSNAIRGVGDATKSVADAGVSVIKFGKDVAWTYAQWRLFSAVRNPAGLKDFAIGALKGAMAARTMILAAKALGVGLALGGGAVGTAAAAVLGLSNPLIGGALLTLNLGKAFLNARDRAYEMAAAITTGTTTVETLGQELGAIRAKPIADLAASTQEMQAAGQRSEKAFTQLSDVFVTPFVGAFAAIQSGLSGLSNGFSSIVEGLAAVFSPIAELLAPVFTFIGTIVEGVLKLVGVFGQLIGTILKVAGAVIRTFLSPFIAGLSAIANFIRGGMNAAFSYVVGFFDKIDKRIQGFYAFMSKVPLIGGAFAAGPAATPEQVMPEAPDEEMKAAEDTLRRIRGEANGAASAATEFGQAGFNAAYEYQQQLALLQQQFADGMFNENVLAQKAEEAKDKFREQIDAIKARNKALAEQAEEDRKAEQEQQRAITRATDAFFNATQAAQEFGAAGQAAAAEYQSSLMELNERLEDGRINEAEYAKEADKLRTKFSGQIDAMREARRQEEENAKQSQRIDEDIAKKQEQIDAMQAEKAAALQGKSNEALKANDIRSSEGMAQFIALATGRQDPAIEENRKTNAKLEEIRNELRALQQEKVDILGAAA